MEKDDPQPETNPARDRPPPRPPGRTAIGLGPDDDDSNKYGKGTVTKSAEGEGKFIRQSGGRGQHGHIIIRIAPNGRGKGNVIANDIPEDKIPDKYVKAAIVGILNALDLGVLGYSKFLDIVVHIVGGSLHETDSNELAFTMAGIFAVKNAIPKAGPIAIE